MEELNRTQQCKCLQCPQRKYCTKLPSICANYTPYDHLKKKFSRESLIYSLRTNQNKSWQIELSKPTHISLSAHTYPIASGSICERVCVSKWILILIHMDSIFTLISPRCKHASVLQPTTCANPINLIGPGPRSTPGQLLGQAVTHTHTQAEMANKKSGDGATSSAMSMSISMSVSSSRSKYALFARWKLRLQL